VIVLLAFAAVIAWLRPDLLNEALGRPPPPPSGSTQEERDAEQARILAEHRALYGQLSVTSEPAGAQVLLFIGRGPAVATDLPTGAAYELVAFADGHSASRAIVPADGTWEETPEGPRYELALQTSDVEIDLAHLDLGATRLPRDAMGTPSGTLGSVRVVTSPPGARVYMLIGFTPDVHVENIHTDQPVELLVYEEGFENRADARRAQWTGMTRGTARGPRKSASRCTSSLLLVVARRSHQVAPGGRGALLLLIGTAVAVPRGSSSSPPPSRRSGWAGHLRKYRTRLRLLRSDARAKPSRSPTGRDVASASRTG